VCIFFYHSSVIKMPLTRAQVFKAATLLVSATGLCLTLATRVSEAAASLDSRLDSMERTIERLSVRVDSLYQRER
jgi:hypothetical protein